ncbi:MAG: PAS domain-containing sensor histidine kinase [Blastopirellula sp.]|nr:MAG: PAS domain-containing sensor histidine kinase [Blastopirellula sp.]
MLTSRLSWKLYATYATLTLISTAVLVAILSSQLKEIVSNRIEQRLHDSAIILRDNLTDVFPSGSSPILQARLKRLGDQTDSRFTLVFEDGTVIGDSEEDPAVMENHRDRQELIQARSQEFGVSQRPSPTLGIPMMYVALRVGTKEAPIGFVRVATPMESVDSQVAAVQRIILGTAVFVSLVALTLIYFIVGRIIRPLAKLTQAVKSIAEGEIQQEVLVLSNDELGILGEAFNIMSRQLSHRIDEIDSKGKQFAENSERLEAVLGGMREGVLAVDGDEKILFVNKAAHSLLEFANVEVVGTPIWETVRSPLIHEVVQKALKNDTKRHVELELPRTQAIVELSATRLPGEPCPGVILVLHDVTELRQLENVRQQFVSNVSHELKTPLASIQAYTETLLEGAISDTQHNRLFLQRIDEQAERLHTLILDLLRLARIESEENTFDLEPVSLGSAIEKCVFDHQKIAQSKKVTLKYQPSDTIVNVVADEEGLRTILDNLVENGLNYTPQGGSVEIRVVTTVSVVVLQVQDTGVGIAEEHHARIFERFYRVDKARSRELGGTGLGLSIVKHLALKFDASVEVSSEAGKGTRFSVNFPLI